MKRHYLGLSTSGHDPALAVVDAAGNVLYAEATERFLQDKRGWGAAPDHPGHVRQALAQLGIEARAEFVVASSWSRIKAELPVAVNDNLLPAADGYWIRSLQARMQEGAGGGLALLAGRNRMPDIRFFDHHLCHAVAACHSAPFRDGLCLVLDGEGEVGAASLYRLEAGRLKRLWRSWGPGSLGVFYGWLTRGCGFDWRAGEEWKVMGLAAFGTPDPELAATLAGVLEIHEGRPQLAEDAAIAAANQALRAHGRQPGQPLMQAADLAASGQLAYATLVDRILSSCLEQGTENLVVTGGCALNSSYNGTLLRRFPLRAVHVPSAPADDGNALGAALLAWMQDHPQHPIPQGNGSPFTGAAADPAVVAETARRCGFPRVEHLGADAPRRLAQRLAQGRIIGVMRGRAEYGPRALGHRSILADPRPPEMKERLNKRVKGREAYRPFAPVVAQEQVDAWFLHPQPSPYMSFTLPWREAARARVPAVVHQDGTGRLQTVAADTNPWMHALVSAFGAETGTPIVLNTSFNVMGKPIVHSVQDAMAVLATTGLDGVLLEDVLIEKDDG